MWRGGLGAAYLFPPLSSGGASIASPCSVSTSRSSNRTYGFPASGSPTAVAFRHTLPTLSRRLHLKTKLQAGRLPHYLFRGLPTTKSLVGLLSVHSRYGLHTRRVALRPSTPEASEISLPTSPLRLLPTCLRLPASPCLRRVLGRQADSAGWLGSNTCRVGLSPTGDPRLFTAH